MAVAKQSVLALVLAASACTTQRDIDFRLSFDSSSCYDSTAPESCLAVLGLSFTLVLDVRFEGGIRSRNCHFQPQGSDGPYFVAELPSVLPSDLWQFELDESEMVAFTVTILDGDSFPGCPLGLPLPATEVTQAIGASEITLLEGDVEPIEIVLLCPEVLCLEPVGVH